MIYCARDSPCGRGLNESRRYFWYLEGMPVGNPKSVWPTSGLKRLCCTFGKNSRRWRLAVLAPCMCALLASEELRGGFISASGLKKPPKCGIVATLWAFNIRCWHGLDFFFPFAHHFNWRWCFRLDFFWAGYAGFCFFSKTTLFAGHDRWRFLRLESQSSSAFWTEFHASTTPIEFPFLDISLLASGRLPMALRLNLLQCLTIR